MNLPNKITLTRIFMIPLFAAVFYLGDLWKGCYFIAAAVFALAALTDFLDGHIARKYGLVTNMGKFLDPIADKVLVSTAFILMLTRPQVFLTGALSSWGLIVAGIAVALIMARELIVSGFRLIAVERGLVLAADKLGKVKTFTQDIAIFEIIMTMPFLGFEGDIIGCALGLAILLLAAFLTVLSGCNYIIRNRQVLKDTEDTEDGQS